MSRMAKKIILDCDPGHDDALAMTMAVASPKIDLFSGHRRGTRLRTRR